MRTLLKNVQIVNVFSCGIQHGDVLISDDIILAAGPDAADLCRENPADEVIDLNGLYVTPGLIDGHIHIESTMLQPGYLAEALVSMGTTVIVADPHEIANVAGNDGLDYMLEASRNLPLDIYYMLPSCVPACAYDQSNSRLSAADLKPYYENPRVLGLGEVMAYTDVISRQPDMMQKLEDARQAGRLINGHAPLITGPDLNWYITAGIQDDHECASFQEAREKIEKGMWVMIRQGTAAKNLPALMALFQFPWADRCLLCTDDKHPEDLMRSGHINHILQQAVELGADPVLAIRMATWNAAQCYHLSNQGAIAPGYRADLVVWNNLEDFKPVQVWKKGQILYRKDDQLRSQKHIDAAHPVPNSLLHTFHMNPPAPEDFDIPVSGLHPAHVIGWQPDSLITEDLVCPVDFSKDNGVSLLDDRIKIAVLERYGKTGDIGLGLISGTNLRQGALASSVSHDAHNLIVMGTSSEDMAAAARAVCEMQGGLAAVKDGEILASLPLPVGGLMSDMPASETAAANEKMWKAVHDLGSPYELFMSMAFMSLPVIPFLKLTPSGLVDASIQPIDLIDSTCL